MLAVSRMPSGFRCIDIMTKFRTDVPDGDIDWRSLLVEMAAAGSFSAMRDPIYASGALRTGYLDRVTNDVEIAEETIQADLDRLRDILTWIVRGDRFDGGVGDEAYWSGSLDAVFEEIGDRVGLPYSLPRGVYVLPRRIPGCPTCSDTRRVQIVVYGMPPAPPVGVDESRICFPGCLTNGTEPSWFCPSCEMFYDYPGYRITDDSVLSY